MNGDEYSQDELRAILVNMDGVSKRVYDLMFRANIGGSCHAMIEFCGLISKYVQMCERAAARGIQFPFMNTHSKTAIPMEMHDAAYLAEKFDCIFGAYFKANPAAARLFAKEALGLDVEP